MTAADDREALAAEYVLGTLDAEERARAETLIAADAGFAALVRAWERRLGELHVMIEPVEPPARVWDRIKAGVAAAPSASKPWPAAQAPSAQVIDLTRRLNRWRGYAAAASALAAVLLLFVAVREFAPGLWPAPKPGRLVAMLQKEPGAPAFLLTVDLDTRTLFVRRVEAQPQPDKSYELWLVSKQFPAPRSLGVVGAGEFTRRATLAAYDPKTINDATYAISLEPQGGSPTGAPTGPVLFTGKLIEATPPNNSSDR